MLPNPLIWLYGIYTLLITASAEPWEIQTIGKFNENDKYAYVSSIEKLGLRGDELVQIMVNDWCYGGGKKASLCSEQDRIIHQNSLALSKNECINRVEYQRHKHLTFISFCTNKGQCIEGGKRMHESFFDELPVSPDWEYGRLQNVRIFGMEVYAQKYINWLRIFYYNPDQRAKLKASKVRFILDYTPSLENMTVYNNPYVRMAEAYTETCNLFGCDIDSFLGKEIINRLDDKYIITFYENKFQIKLIEAKLERNSTTKYLIPQGKIGLKLGVGELLKVGRTYYLFPTSMPLPAIMKTSDVEEVRGQYDLSAYGLEDLMHLEKYKTYRGNLKYYYADAPGRSWHIKKKYIGLPLFSEYKPENYAYSMNKVLELGLYSDLHSSLSQITINGEFFCGPRGGIEQGLITLDTDEYINKVEYRYEMVPYDSSFNVSVLNYIGFGTNTHKFISAGNNGTNGLYRKLTNIRLLMITCRGQLELTYVPNYQPSQRVSKNVTFVLDFTPALKDMRKYVRSTEKIYEAYIKTFKNIEEINHEQHIGLDVLLKISDHNGLNADEYKWDILQMFDEFQRELELIKEYNLTKNITIFKDHVGVKVASGELWKGPSGIYWIIPRTIPRISMYKTADIFRLLNCYDLTGKLHTYMFSLKKYQKIQHGFVYYSKPNRSQLFYMLDERQARKWHNILFGFLSLLIVLFTLYHFVFCNTGIV